MKEDGEEKPEEVIYVDRDRAAAVSLGTKDIRSDLKSKKRRRKGKLLVLTFFDNLNFPPKMDWILGRRGQEELLEDDSEEEMDADSYLFQGQYELKWDNLLMLATKNLWNPFLLF